MLVEKGDPEQDGEKGGAEWGGAQELLLLIFLREVGMTIELCFGNLDSCLYTRLHMDIDVTRSDLWTS